jgi:hypothetical protein
VHLGHHERGQEGRRQPECWSGRELRQLAPHFTDLRAPRPEAAPALHHRRGRRPGLEAVKQDYWAIFNGIEAPPGEEAVSTAHQVGLVPAGDFDCARPVIAVFQMHLRAGARFQNRWTKT